MNWKKYKSLSMAEKQNESYYIIGLDLGNDSSGMAFYNVAQGAPETIDLSGGYGKPSVPTVMQYIADSKEWVFGEYAMLNRGAGKELTISSLMERLGQFDYIDVDRRSVSVAGILGMFIKEILSNVKSINPKAEIVGIVATVPAYFSEQAYEELQRAFKIAGYDKELIGLVPDRECVLAHYFRGHNEVAVPGEAAPMGGYTLLLDFGARELRGGLYQVTRMDDKTTVASMSSLFSGEIGMSKINADVAAFYENFVITEMGKGKPLSTDKMRQIKEHVAAFAHQHKDILFQKGIRQKPVKVYFNFCYPPFQQTITAEQIQNLIKPYARRFDAFVQDVLDKSICDKAITHDDVDTVLCVGGGFEMLWAKDAVAALFPNAKVQFYKNSKMVTSEGAAIVAARALGAAGTSQLVLEDKHQLTCDIGLTDGENFLPLVDRNAFWWQPHPPKLVIVNREVDGELGLSLCMREMGGDLHSIGKLLLSGLPVRPKGTTRLEIGLSFVSNAEAIVTVRDKGFGELFPRVDYERVAQVKLEAE